MPHPPDAGATNPPLFVYGTLMPGHLRWPVLEPHALSWRPAAVEGRLYDSGEGWPTARFGPGPDLVRGWAVDLRPEVADIVLRHLDEVEDVATGLFRRVTVPLLDGGPAIAYEMTTDAGSLTRIDVWDTQPEA